MGHHTYVVEGPAGSGKTTLVVRLVKTYKYAYVDPKLERPRTYDGYDGEMMAIIKDTVAGSLTFPGHHCVIDRWLLSSFIYSCIRQGRSFVDEPARRAELEAFLLLGLGIRRLIAENMALRGHAVEVKRPKWLLLLPPIEQIRQRRKLIHRAFPYEAEVEYGLYEWAAANWPDPKAVGELAVIPDNDCELPRYL